MSRLELWSGLLRASPHVMGRAAQIHQLFPRASALAALAVAWEEANATNAYVQGGTRDRPDAKRLARLRGAGSPDPRALEREIVALGVAVMGLRHEHHDGTRTAFDEPADMPVRQRRLLTMLYMRTTMATVHTAAQLREGVAIFLAGRPNDNAVAQGLAAIYRVPGREGG